MYQLIIIILLMWTTHALASEANVIEVAMKRGDDGSYTFNVTVQHEDEGWNHYVDHWLILD